jgi:hypothetical protein
VELVSVVLARSIGFVETGFLNPRGELPWQKLVSLLLERFSFMEVPAKLEDLDRSKGITFKAGYFDGQGIDVLTIYNDGIKIDLRSSTENGQKIITDSLEWLREKAGLAYRTGMIARWAYLSQFVVRSDIGLDTIHPAFSVLSEKVSEYVNQRTNEHYKYRISGISFDFPKLTADYPIAPFLIERRVKTPDSENLFYCQAPLQTTQHLEVLREFERGLSKTS